MPRENSEDEKKEILKSGKAGELAVRFGRGSEDDEDDARQKLSEKKTLVERWLKENLGGVG